MGFESKLDIADLTIGMDASEVIEFLAVDRNMPDKEGLFDNPDPDKLRRARAATEAAIRLFEVETSPADNVIVVDFNKRKV